MSTADGTAAHRAAAARASLRCVVITVSDSRTEETDTAGPRAAALLTGDGHTVIARALLKNDATAVRALVQLHLAQSTPDVILLTGGTGLSARDRTVEAVTPLFTKEIPGFGELFRLVSFHEQIGAAAMLSRAVAGSVNGTMIVSLPGSIAAVELALTRLLLPELRHLIHELRR
jgi:molybdenum cofactor biosynthesis protein B